MEAMREVLRYINIAAFAALTAMTLAQWLKRRDRPSKWAALTFATLAVVLLAGVIVPEEREGDLLRRVEIAILLLFPYFLFRFMAAFRSPRPRFEYLAAALTALVIGSAFVIDLPADDDADPSGGYRLFVVAALVQWVTLSAIVAVRFWKAGRGRPLLTRNRMRLLSMASLALAGAIVVAGATTGSDSPAVSAVTQGIVLASALTFFMAFNPPKSLRARWRRPAEEALRGASLGLMRAELEEEVTQGLLPHVVQIVGGRAAAVMGRQGELVGGVGIEDDMVAAVEPLERDVGGVVMHDSVIRVAFPFGTLVVWTSPYTPFFGRDEVELLRSLGALADLALQRVRSADLRERLAKVELKKQQALEINDNVVQGLAVAKLAFDLGDIEKGRAAVDETLDAARAIITDLLEGLAGTEGLGPGALVRERPAQVLERDRDQA